MNFIRKLYHHPKKILRVLYRAADFRSAKEKLLFSNALSDEEKALLSKVSLRVHRNDEMYKPIDARHYLSVGLSAVRCIENALDKSNGDKAVRHILDFPCGYGRVLRFLRVRFPDANITVSDINPVALDFCKRIFSVKSVMSDKDFNKLSLSGKFDLLWCGSLITHIDEKATTDLLKFFHDHLSPGGLCVFTTHGQTSVEWIQGKRETYRLTEVAQQEVLSQFHEKGYGYADYKNQRGIGISVVSHDRMLVIARSVRQWNETFYLEQGWDNHQDVYGFTNAEPGAAAEHAKA
ncbi:class I SAM-dependent methyltransferase [candidate division TA06 bacterium]|nr:class I SAM-dependent methyltransferase [candidate division TA06 bacterium]